MEWGRIIDIIEDKSGKSICKELNVRPQYLSDLRSGKSKNPNSDFVLNLINVFNLNPNWLLTGEGEMFQGKKEEVATVPHKVPLLRQTVSCGPGQDWLDKDAIDSYIEPLDLIPKEAGAEIFAFRVKGTSMVGAGINDGDVVLFDARKGRDVSDDLYVFALDGSVYCKLLKFDSISQKIHIYSLHTSEVEKAELLRSLDANDADAMDTFHLFGRVMAWIRENRVVRR